MGTRVSDTGREFKGDPLGDVEGLNDIFERQYGAELARWEMDVLSRFRERVANTRQYIHRGFVHHTRNPSLVVLAPSPWLADGVFVYLREGQDAPPDGALVEVTGFRIAVPVFVSHEQTTVEAFTADSVKLEPLDLMERVSPPMKLDELSTLLFENVGLAEPSKRIFARLFVSSPPYGDAVGGLTSGIQAMASQKQIRRLLTFMKSVLPVGLRKRHGTIADVRGVKTYLPKIWRLDVGPYSPSRLRTLCTGRRDPSGFREVSLTTVTDSTTSALPDVPLALASEDFWIERRDWRGLRLPVIKSVITYQLLVPQVTERSLDSSTRHILERLEHLKESFDLPEAALSRGQVLDADSHGRSLSTLRLARSTARAEWREKVAGAEIKRTWDRLLEPALKEFIELTQLKSDARSQWADERKFDKFNTKVLRAVRRLDPGTSGALGPTLDEIAAESGVERHVAAAELSKMKDAGILYEPRPGHFRLV